MNSMSPFESARGSSASTIATSIPSSPISPSLKSFSPAASSPPSSFPKAESRAPPTSSGSTGPDDVGGALDSAFGNDEGGELAAGEKLFSDGDIGDEGMEVAIVDADEPRADSNGDIEFIGVVDFDEGRDAEFARERVEVGDRRFGQHCRD